MCFVCQVYLSYENDQKCSAGKKNNNNYAASCYRSSEMDPALVISLVKLNQILGPRQASGGSFITKGKHNYKNGNSIFLSPVP